jgi:hypothetical protein
VFVRVYQCDKPQGAEKNMHTTKHPTATSQLKNALVDGLRLGFFWVDNPRAGGKSAQLPTLTKPQTLNPKLKPN